MLHCHRAHHPVMIAGLASFLFVACLGRARAQLALMSRMWKASSMHCPRGFNPRAQLDIFEQCLHPRVRRFGLLGQAEYVGVYIRVAERQMWTYVRAGGESSWLSSFQRVIARTKGFRPGQSCHLCILLPARSSTSDAYPPSN